MSNLSRLTLLGLALSLDALRVVFDVVVALSLLLVFVVLKRTRRAHYTDESNRRLMNSGSSRFTPC